MTITAVEKNKDKGMVKVFIDDNYSFSIPEQDYINNKLYKDTIISEEQLSVIRDKVLVRSARERAVRYLTYKDRSEYEILKKLVDAGYDESVAQNAVNELKTIGYLDDTRFAMKYLSERIRTKALSKKTLGYELKNKGLEKEIIERALSEFEINDYEVALREGKRKFGKYDINDKKIQQKVYRFLLHRGFSYEIADKVVRELKKN
ncbi:MAG TPA: regulatory protein RecX [Clostridiaceae bacterium]|jgi:regulatory protein|nr:regulatory protein RecX [Clostridiaceae bacterium]